MLANDVAHLARTPTCNVPYMWLLCALALNSQSRTPSPCHPHQWPAKNGYLIELGVGGKKCDLPILNQIN